MDSENSQLNESVQKLIATNEKLVRSQGLWPSLLRGLIIAIGSTVGFALVVSALIYLLKIFGVLAPLQPYLDKFIQR